MFRGELVRGGNGGNGEATARGEQGVLGSGSRRRSREGRWRLAREANGREGDAAGAGVQGEGTERPVVADRAVRGAPGACAQGECVARRWDGARARPGWSVRLPWRGSMPAEMPCRVASELCSPG